MNIFDKNVVLTKYDFEASNVSKLGQKSHNKFIFLWKKRSVQSFSKRFEILRFGEQLALKVI